MRSVIFRGLATLAFTAMPFAAGAQPRSDAAAPHVATRQGGLVGTAGEGGTKLFLGVPFARPPVGDLRWRPPQPIRWTGDRAAAAPGPACLQAPLGWNDKDAARSSEDCLYLDVATPTLEPTARRPVVVWIHGGANWAGSGDGVVRSSLARQDVVVVSVQYRLGVFGFLSHPALSAEGGGASGNYALMDLIAALQWVHDNIAAFGGDPSNVTLVGHSAGAQDVGLLMLSPKARGLFSRGVLESGTPGFGFAARTLAQNEAIGVDLARLTSGPEGASSAAGLAALRRASGAELLKAAKGLVAPIDDQSFIWTQAVVDGVVLPRAPEDLLAQGPSGSMIVGDSAREIALFGADPQRARAWIGTQPPRAAASLLKTYGLDRAEPPSPDAVNGDVAMRVATDRMFRCPGNFVAAQATALGQQVWRYELQVPAPGKEAVTHGSELPYVFDGGGVPPLQAYWLNFARSGDPNGPGLPAWPTYGAAGRYLAFTETGPVARRGLAQTPCEMIQRP